jgi:hypothetical protein
MVAVIGAAVLTGLGASAATAATFGGTVGSVLLAGAAYGINALLGPKPQEQKREATQATLNQSMGVRRRVYGKAMVSGTRAFWDARNGNLYQAIVLASGRIESIEEFWVGDKVVSTSLGSAGGIVAESPWTGTLTYETHLGLATETASAILTGAYPGEWTSAHRGDGLAYVVVEFQGVSEKLRNKIWPQGANTVLRFVIKGARVWDTSIEEQDGDDESTWTWSESPAHCILDYIRHQDGMRQPLSKIDVASFTALHATCIESVSRKDDSTEARYRLWGSYELNEEPKEVLARMCATCDATLVQGPTGLIGIRGGKWTSPLVNIPTDIIVKGKLTQGNNRLSKYNRLKVTYTDPDNYWQATELQARDNAASQAAIGVIDEMLDLSMVPSWTQAARLAKIRMEKENPIWKGTVGCHLGAIAALGQETIDLDWKPGPNSASLLDGPCALTSLSVRGDASGVDLGFVSFAPEIYDWDEDAEEPPRPVIPAVLAGSGAIPTPAGVSAETELPTISGGTVGIIAVVEWTAPTRIDLETEAQYSIEGDDMWVPMTIRADGLSAESALLIDGEDYDIRVRHFSGGSFSDWVDAGPIEARSDTVPPDPPVGFVANGGVGQTLVAWTAPNSANYYATRIYRHTTTTFADATLIDTRLGAPNMAGDLADAGLTAGTYYYWARAINRAGVGDASSTAGPMTSTVT